MPNTRVLQRSFAGGEMSPEMYGRIDDVKYQTGAAKMRNFIAAPQGPIENNPSGYDDLREFMLYLIQKNKVEFMPNRGEASNYDTFILESTDQSNTGTAFKLKELYTEGLPFHYETGLLKFRRID
jgi:hypothetical protein